MKRKKRRDKVLSSVLTTTMLTVNLSASVFSSAALADSVWNRIGPGFVGEAVPAVMPTGTLPENSPYKEVMVPLSEEGWLSISGYQPQDIKGVSFEVGCKIDWDGGGGGGIYIDNWDNVPQFSFTTMKDRITYMFQPEEILRMKQDIKLNLWWTWADAQGNTHLKDIFFKPGSVRLIVDKDAQPMVRPTASVRGNSSGGGGGGGGGKGGRPSQGNGSFGSVTTGNSNRGYNYVVKEKGIIQKIAMKDICPDYQLGDIVKITMKTLGGSEWNSFDLYCAEDGETKIVKKPGGSAHKETTIELTAKPDNGVIFVQINWLGGDYMMYGFDVDVVGHGEPVEDVVIKQFTKEEFEQGFGDYFYRVPVSIAEEMERIGAEFGRDEVTITVGLESDGWWNGVLGASGPDGWFQEEYYNGFESSASLTIVPTADNFSVNIGAMDGTYGEIKNLRLKKTGNQVKPPEILASFSKEEFEAGKGEHFYAVPISIAEKMKEIGAEFGRDEVKITVELESDDWWNGVLGANGPDGWYQEEYYNGFGTTASLTIVPTSDNFRVNVGTLNGSYGKVKSISVEKTGKQIQPEVIIKELTAADFTDAVKDGENYVFDLSEQLKEAMPKDIELGTDTVEITATVKFTGCYTWNQLQMGTAEGMISSEQMKPTGDGTSTVTIKGIPTDNLSMQWVFLSGQIGGNGSAKIQSLEVKKAGSEDKKELLSITYDAYKNAESTDDGSYKKSNISALMGDAFTKAGVKNGDKVTVTAEFESSGINWWQFCGSFLKGKESDWGSTSAADKNKITWTGIYYGGDWAEIQMETMQEGGYLNMISLDVTKESEIAEDNLPKISYDTYSKLNSTNDANQFKQYDVSSILKETLTQEMVQNGDKVTITAEFESSGIDWWQFCGSFLKGKEDDWGSTSSADKNKITWTGIYYGGDWAEIQMGEMQATGYLNMISLKVEVTDSGAGVQSLSLDDEEYPLEDIENETEDQPTTKDKPTTEDKTATETLPTTEKPPVSEEKPETKEPPVTEEKPEADTPEKPETSSDASDDTEKEPSREEMKDKESDDNETSDGADSDNQDDAGKKEDGGSGQEAAADKDAADTGKNDADAADTDTGTGEDAVENGDNTENSEQENSKQEDHDAQLPAVDDAGTDGTEDADKGTEPAKPETKEDDSEEESKDSDCAQKISAETGAPAETADVNSSGSDTEKKDKGEEL